MKQAVIFDMDGVISDSQKLHAEAESKILQKLGIKMKAEEITKKYAGVTDKEMFHEILNKFKINTNNLSTIIDKKWQMMNDIPNKNIQAIPFAIKLINLLYKQYKLAIASSSPIAFIKHVTTSLDIKDKFDLVISAQQVKHGKPSPDIFLLTASRLLIKPKDCIVIEDALSGVIGAKKAGMKTIALVTNKDNTLHADMEVTSLNEIHLRDIQFLFKT